MPELERVEGAEVDRVGKGAEGRERGADPEVLARVVALGVEDAQLGDGGRARANEAEGAGGLQGDGG